MENDKLTKISQEMKQKQISSIKEIICLTFEQLQVLEKMRNRLQEQIKVLKLDLLDLKDGRLDRIYERQCIDESCKETSILGISKKEGQGEGNPWYISYEIIFNSHQEDAPLTIYINNSLTKLHASGAYKLKDGTIKYL